MLRWMVVLVGLGLPVSSMPESELPNVAETRLERVTETEPRKPVSNSDVRGDDRIRPLSHVIAEKY